MKSKALRLFIIIITVNLLVMPITSSAQTGYICGDADGDQAVNLVDILYLIDFVYQSGPAPLNMDAANVNADSDINLLDILVLIDNIYAQGDDLTCGPVTTVPGYTIVDTGEDQCFDNISSITCADEGQSFYGQDAQFDGNPFSYEDNGDGTITDLNTGLMWQKDPGPKVSYVGAIAAADTFSLAGYDDWRVPTIKELYSLMDFRGLDPSGWSGTDTSLLDPFINTDYFGFEYGDLSAGDRIIDAQYWSSTEYTSTTIFGATTTFGVNFADGRIKGYPNEPMGPPGDQYLKTSFVKFVRGRTDYGVNDYVDNGDGTVTDQATGLMWQKADDGVGRNWQQALDYAENLNLAGHTDWRLPNAKELQSIVDYSRSPVATNSPAIDPVFDCSVITDEGGNDNYGFYWTGTTHEKFSSVTLGDYAVYVCFGEALGFMESPPGSGLYELMDVHGAGAQRSDPKTGNPDDYPYGHGPQGDVIRIYNLVRCVRDTQ